MAGARGQLDRIEAVLFERVPKRRSHTRTELDRLDTVGRLEADPAD